MSNQVKGVEIRAELRQIKSMADHSYNLVLNVPEDCLPQVQQLMGWLGDEITALLVDGSRLDRTKTRGE